MRKLVVCSAIMSCFMLHNFAHAQTYTSIHTLGKIHIIKAKGTGVLDLTELTKSNPRLAFAVKDSKSGEISYTRDSLFYGKNDGYYYQGHNRLQGYPVATDITSTDCKLTDIKSPPEEIPAVATTTVDYYNGNLSASDVIPSTAPFDPSNAATFNYTTGANIYDSLGVKHLLSVYYIKGRMNTWTTAIYVDGNNIGSGTLTFSSAGMLVASTGMNTLSFCTDSGATCPQEFSLHFEGITQFGTPDGSNPPSSDGMPAGIYSYYMIDDNGYVSFNYSNGQSITFSKIAVFVQ